MNSPFYLSRSYSQIQDSMSNKNLKSKFNSRITNSKTLANYEVNPCTFSPLLNDEKLQKVKVKEHRVLPNFNKKGPHEAGINLLNQSQYIEVINRTQDICPLVDKGIHLNKFLNDSNTIAFSLKEQFSKLSGQSSINRIQSLPKLELTYSKLEKQVDPDKDLPLFDAFIQPSKPLDAKIQLARANVPHSKFKDLQTHIFRSFQLPKNKKPFQTRFQIPDDTMMENKVAEQNNIIRIENFVHSQELQAKERLIERSRKLFQDFDTNFKAPFNKDFSFVNKKYIREMDKLSYEEPRYQINGILRPNEQTGKYGFFQLHHRQLKCNDRLNL